MQSRNVKNAPTVVRIWYTTRRQSRGARNTPKSPLPGAGSTPPYLLSEVRMPGIQRYSHAYREAYEQLYDYQLGDLTASFVTAIRGSRSCPVTCSRSRIPSGFLRKPFRCVSMPEPVDAGRWKIPDTRV